MADMSGRRGRGLFLSRIPTPLDLTYEYGIATGIRSPPE
jgi:hypothetical protein